MFQAELEKLRSATFGHPQSVWDAAKAEVRVELQNLAKRERTIAYSKLAERVGSIRFAAEDNAFHKLRGQVAMEEHNAGRGMLSVLVVRATGDMRPGPGFFDLAKKLGLDVREPDKFWTDEFRRVTAAWAIK